jgi:hypothetical protein
MSGDTVECFNCGHANPSWAQVCRQCGFAIRPDGPASAGPRGIFPTDQASLISIGGTLGAIVLAIVLGLFVSGMIPAAPNVPDTTSSPAPSGTPLPSASVAPSVSQGVATSATPAPSLPGTVTFGTGLDATTRAVTGATTSFHAGVAFAHSIKLSAPFGVNTVQEEVIKLGVGGTQTIVQARAGSDLSVSASAKVAGFRVRDAGSLIPSWGTGDFILRVYRGTELLAEGHFTLS